MWCCGWGRGLVIPAKMTLLGWEEPEEEENVDRETEGLGVLVWLEA